jgi:hypothetical protein
MSVLAQTVVHILPDTALFALAHLQHALLKTTAHLDFGL